MPIETREDLHEHLRRAMAIELTAFPPYLYAMYSLAEQSSEATKLLRSIAAEEMLHLVLWSNLLLSVGGEPCFYDPGVIPSFPAVLEHRSPRLEVDLAPYSQRVVEEAFLAIEAPTPEGAPSEPDVFEFLGQFYRAIWEGVVRLDGEMDLFADPQVERQFHDPHGYAAPKYDAGSSGGLLIISDVESAAAAMSTIVHQGEGLSDDRYADPDHAELTHYAKFLMLDHAGIEAEGIHPAVLNPRTETLPEAVQPLARLSDALYSYLFVLLDRVYAPDAQDRHHLVGTIYGSMVALLAPVARLLMTIPVSDAEVAGPPFAYFAFADPSKAEAELRELARPVIEQYPSLIPALRSLDRLPG